MNNKLECFNTFLENFLFIYNIHKVVFLIKYKFLIYTLETFHRNSLKFDKQICEKKNPCLYFIINLIFIFFIVLNWKILMYIANLYKSYISNEETLCSIVFSFILRFYFIEQSYFILNKRNEIQTTNFKKN